MGAFSWLRCIFLLACIDHLKSNRLVTACIAKKSVTAFVWLAPAFFLLARRDNQDNLAFRSTRVECISNTSSYSILSSGKQLFIKICGYRHTRKILLSFRSFRIYISVICNSLQNAKTYYNKVKILITIITIITVITVVTIIKF